MMISTPSACIVAERENVAKTVLMPGDPLRAKTIAETYLERPLLFNDVRNMYGYTGIYKGERVSVMGSGMGVPSMTLYAHELYHFFDVETIIRVGSAGALRDELKVRDIVLALGACTNSGFAGQYDWPGTLAPTADYKLLSTAERICTERGAGVRVGNVFTTDVFYNAQGDIAERARDLGMLCVEMETAGLYLEAAHAGKRALSILSISDHMFRHEELTALERQDSFREMMEVALDTAVESVGA